MAKRIHKIPLNTQNARSIGGLDVWYLTRDESLNHSSSFGTHRDDYYILMIVLKGSGTLRCDMETIHITANSIILIKPYQVHSGAEISEDAEAYFISIAPFVMPPLCNDIFPGLSIPQQFLKIPAAKKGPILSTAKLLYAAFTEGHAYKSMITNNLFNVLILRIAGLFSDSDKKESHTKNRAYLIVQQFKQLVAGHSFLNTPAFFAGKLNITTSHLNDCVKSITGLSVTHFLQDAMLLEAKRNLYYTNDDVKKIAYTLGFGDHAYFSRLFKKLTKETPLAFRRKFRE